MSVDQIRSGESSVKKLVPRQKLWLAIVVVTNLALWIIPSNVVEQIARHRDVLLGRYSRTHFYWIVAIGLLSVVSLYIDRATGAAYKRRWFQVGAASLSLMFGVVLVDFVLRGSAPAYYIRDTHAYHRPAGVEYVENINDVPPAKRTYPNPPAGYKPFVAKLKADARGYRNPKAVDSCDVLALGDSFTEGSSVSDEHPWPRRLEEDSGLSVYSLGMSGYDPSHYLASLREVGLALKPRVVICMIYEGNDFRSAKADRKRLKPSLSKRFDRYVHESPFTKGIDRWVISTFGAINSKSQVKGIELLDWMPLHVPDGPNNPAYAFTPKQLRDLYQSEASFAQDKHWLNPRSQLLDMKKLCDQIGAELVVTFAPTTAHVLLPFVAKRLPADKVRAFTKMKYKGDLPEPREFLETLVTHVEARERVIKQWCQRESIPFVGLTSALREAMSRSEQVYFSYDQHWTPLGHEVVAGVLADYLRSRGSDVEQITVAD